MPEYIERAAAINKIFGYIVIQNCHDVILHNIGIRKALSAIDSLPAADVVERPRWISVEERLPERPASWPNCEIRRCYFLAVLESGCVKSLGFEFDKMQWQPTASPVTHWMPLPEPPAE